MNYVRWEEFGDKTFPSPALGQKYFGGFEYLDKNEATNFNENESQNTQVCEVPDIHIRYSDIFLPDELHGENAYWIIKINKGRVTAHIALFAVTFRSS